MLTHDPHTTQASRFQHQSPYVRLKLAKLETNPRDNLFVTNDIPRQHECNNMTT